MRRKVIDVKNNQHEENHVGHHINYICRHQRADVQTPAASHGHPNAHAHGMTDDCSVPGAF